MHTSVSILDGPLPETPQPLGEAAEGAGAVLTFDGVVRPSEDGRAIEALEYEVYSPMADRMLEELAEDAGRRFGLTAVAIEHSRKRVDAGRCSFRLRVASPHRAEGLEAAGWFIERMKRDVPIWKRAVYADAPEGASR